MAHANKLQKMAFTQLKYFKEIKTTMIKVKKDKKVDKATVLAMLSDILFGE